MDESRVLSYLIELEQALIIKSNRRQIVLELEWIRSINHLSTPGVYLFYEDDEPCYVGETGNLRKRMNDLRNTMNHTLRRNFWAQTF